MANKWIEFVKKWALDKHISYRDALKDPKLKIAYNKKHPKDIKGAGQSSSKNKIAPEPDMKEVKKLLAKSAKDKRVILDQETKEEKKPIEITDIAIDPSPVNSSKNREIKLEQKAIQRARKERGIYRDIPITTRLYDEKDADKYPISESIHLRYNPKIK